ncbi:hypothetical protein RQP46_006130 [Phenoliferia psychrophenolica]
MKFGRYLKDNSVEEWRRAYINYRLIKKAILKAAAELDERTVLDLSRPSFAGSPDLERGTRRISIAVQPPAPPLRPRLTSRLPTIRRMDTFMTLTGAMDVNPKRLRKDFPATLSLEELIGRLPGPATRRFFEVLKKELERVEGFYAEREKEAGVRFGELKEQWRELENHKKEAQEHNHRTGTPSSLDSRIPGSPFVRRVAKRSVAAFAPSPHLPPKTRMRSRFKEREPEKYASARSKLKLATFEFYRSLGILKSYKVLNCTGFAKSLKKFEKATRIPCASAFSPTLLHSQLESSTRLDELIRGTEDAFARVFEHGDRKKARASLRELGSHKMHHFSHRALLQLFGAIYLPVLFSMAFYINILAWHYARINYVLIFELDIRSRLDLHQVTEIPAILFFVLSLFFWGAFSNFWPNQIPPSAYPLGFVVFAVGFIFSPFPVLYPSARNSLYYSVYNLGFLSCTYDHSWPNNVADICSTNNTWTSAALASLPALWRLGQSIRRYIDSDGVTIHLLNAGKYSMSVAYYFAYFGWRINGSQGGWRLGVWLLFSVLNSSYVFTWDMVMDWSLFRKGSRHFLLRPELGFKDHVWVYYVAIVLDFLLRFSWVLYLAPEAVAPSVTLRGFIIAAMEVGRRVIWNAFRVESEHIGNVDGYRVTRNVPLPYVLPGSTVNRLFEPDTASRKARLSSFVHNLFDGLAKNFRPIAHAAIPVLRTRTTNPTRSRSTSVKKPPAELPDSEL